MRIEQVPELGVVEDEPAVVADGRVPLGAGAEALLSRGHPFLMFLCASRQPFLRRRVLLCLNSPSLEHAVPTPRWDVQRVPWLGDALWLSFGSVQKRSWPHVRLGCRLTRARVCARKLVPHSASFFSCERCDFAAHDPYGSTLPCRAALRRCGQPLWATAGANSARTPRITRIVLALAAKKALKPTHDGRFAIHLLCIR